MKEALRMFAPIKLKAFAWVYRIGGSFVTLTKGTLLATKQRGEDNPPIYFDTLSRRYTLKDSPSYSELSPSIAEHTRNGETAKYLVYVFFGANEKANGETKASGSGARGIDKKECAKELGRFYGKGFSLLLGEGFGEDKAQKFAKTIADYAGRFYNTVLPDTVLVPQKDEEGNPLPPKVKLSDVSKNYVPKSKRKRREYEERKRHKENESEVNKDEE